eukprot:scaffold7393_cov497-Prasinococcus_capsulatus_cf.AAC.3
MGHAGGCACRRGPRASWPAGRGALHVTSCCGWGSQRGLVGASRWPGPRTHPRASRDLQEALFRPPPGPIGGLFGDAAGLPLRKAPHLAKTRLRGPGDAVTHEGSAVTHREPPRRGCEAPSRSGSHHWA